MNKIVIAGGTGFIGTYFFEKFRQLGYEVHIISRQKGHIQWTETEKVREVLDGSTLLVNLAGKSVDCRYSEENKEAILRSRTETTKILGHALQQCAYPPSLWINSSTATIYRHAEDRPMTESTGEIGKGFSVNVATSWEEALFSFQTPQTRKIALRIAIVLGDGGAMKPLENLVIFGLGGPQGKGTQMFSWIHIEDLFQIILFLQSQPALDGVFNCSSPHPVNNTVFMKTLREAMHVKIGLPSPEWLLKIGAFMIRTEPELVLKSRWVLPERLTQNGYQFLFPELKGAFEQILHK